MIQNQIYISTFSVFLNDLEDEYLINGIGGIDIGFLLL